jgi:hypothetical protein
LPGFRLLQGLEQAEQLLNDRLHRPGRVPAFGGMLELVVVPSDDSKCLLRRARRPAERLTDLGAALKGPGHQLEIANQNICPLRGGEVPSISITFQAIARRAQSLEQHNHYMLSQACV